MNMEWNGFWHWECYHNIVISSRDKKPISPSLCIKNAPKKTTLLSLKVRYRSSALLLLWKSTRIFAADKKTWTEFPDYLTREVCRLQGCYELGLWVKAYESNESYKRTFLDSDIIWQDINSNIHQVQSFSFPLTKVYGRRLVTTRH